MGVNLSIKSVPENVAQRLRERAERNHRSLQGELMAIVEKAAYEFPQGEPVRSGTLAEPPQAASSPRRGQSVRRGHRSIEDLAAELRALYPRPVVEVPKAVDIVRELRDKR